MNAFLYVFLACVVLLIVALFATRLLTDGRKHDRDREFLDSEGDHSYYDRHLIEKKDFKKANPDVKDHEIRSLRAFMGIFRIWK